MNKKLENFKDILTGLKYNLSIIYYLLLWDYELCSSWLAKCSYELPNHKNVYQIRNHSRGVGASLYINKNFGFKIRHDLSINWKDLESIYVERLFIDHQMVLLTHLKVFKIFLGKQKILTKCIIL